METQTVRTGVRPNLHDTLVNTRSDWKLCRVFGRSENGEPLDIIIEPIFGGITVSKVNHLSEPVNEVYFCAHGSKSLSNIRNGFELMGSGFEFNTDGLWQFRAKAEVEEAVKQITELISTLTRDSQ